MRRTRKWHAHIAHQADLTESLQSFRKVSSRITVARERIRNVRNSLSSCKSLLQCKRDELRKLWMESAEQKHIAQLLLKVEEIKDVPRFADEAIGKKLFLKASELLLNASVNLDGDLVVVEGLQNMKTEVQAKTDDIFRMILDEINHTLYLRASEELMYELHRSAVARTASLAEPSQHVPVATSKNSVKEGACLMATEEDCPVLRDNGCALEDEKLSGPDSSPVQYFAVLVEALAVLHRIPEGVEALKHQITAGLTRMVQYTAQFYYDYHMKWVEQDGWSKGIPGSAGDSRHLVDVLALIFRQFKIVFVLHHLLLAQIIRAKERRHLDGIQMYGMDDVWAQMQMALQQILGDYLDVRGTARMGAMEETSVTALSSFFAKKRVVKPKKPTLFKFQSTAHAINVSAFAKEQKTVALPQKLTLLSPKESSEQVWVCSPSPSNITAIFRPVVKFSGEMEMKLGSKGRCQLKTFLEDYVKDIFLPRMKNELRERADATLRSSDAWNTVVGGEEQKRLDAPVSVLASSARTLELCGNVQGLIQALPVFAEQLAALWLLVLGEYQVKIKAEYQKVTMSIRQMEGTDQPTEWRKISAAWAVDEDISRLLKSLPNWTSLMTESTLDSCTPFSPQTAPVTPLAESAEEIRNRNQRESELLIGNLGTQKKIESWEIIQDVHHMRALANIHESLEWFCVSIRRLLADLPQTIQERLKKSQVQIERAEAPEEPPTVVSLSDGFEGHLSALGEMASTCLLMLHLEVRVHCFFHLLPVARQSSHLLGAAQSQEADPSVLALNRDLVHLHELLTSQVQSRKVRYLFEGLGHLLSVIFIHSSHHVLKINDNGKKRMCRNIFALQQCISGITGSREPDLDTARKFFELLYRTPDEILNGIVERGPEFAELEYRYILALSVRSHPIYSTEPGALDQRIARLREIMAERSK